jgi:hypothetical protein
MASALQSDEERKMTIQLSKFLKKVVATVMTEEVVPRIEVVNLVLGKMKWLPGKVMLTKDWVGDMLHWVLARMVE